MMLQTVFSVPRLVRLTVWLVGALAACLTVSAVPAAVPPGAIDDHRKKGSMP